ncbi:MAG: hypothetical protein KAS32_06175 [Candidatus Peribacteraceae bacterium]|nr:hypothetical protein [Candidatus Peribacteraceae bacterium]
MNIKCPKTLSQCTSWKCTDYKTCPLIHKIKLKQAHLKEIITPSLIITTSTHTDEEAVKFNSHLIASIITQYQEVSTQITELQELQTDLRNQVINIASDLDIRNISTQSISATIYTTDRHQSWINEAEVLSLIPNTLPPLATITPDHKKIIPLIKSGKLPKEILKLQIKTDKTTMIRISNKKQSAEE